MSHAVEFRGGESECRMLRVDTNSNEDGKVELSLPVDLDEQNEYVSDYS
jgi:hypothetical protein